VSNRRYARTARLNELFREILGDELERLDDDRLEMVTVSGVEVDAGLEHAVVYYSSLGGPDADEEILEAFEEVRRGLQSAVARQTRLRSTPKLLFRPDHGIRTGERVDEILRGLHERGELADDDDGEA
jgi:ribosome-binding factor A